MIKKLGTCLIVLFVFVHSNVYGSESRNYVDGEIIVKFTTNDKNAIINFINQIGASFL